MNHVIRIEYTNIDPKKQSTIRKWIGEKDMISHVTSACAFLLGRSIHRASLEIDGVDYPIKQMDIMALKREILHIIKSNEELLDFQINDLFKL